MGFFTTFRMTKWNNMKYLFISIALLAFFALFAGPVSWLERRIAGRIMSRIGPNRVGPQGVIQWLADGLKNFLKEDLIPSGADPVLFRFAPYPVFLGALLTLVTLPFSSVLVGANINVGILYIVGSWGLVVIGLIAAGWGSNNKWSLLGGMRSAAQMVSYEIPMVMSLLVVVLMSGTLSIQDTVKMQGPSPMQWFIFSQPFAFIAFFMFLAAAVAESNRTPFDLPEAESELVAGYTTEYSGMRFLFFFFAEWGNLYIVGAMSAALFLGGWQIPESLRVWAEAKWFLLPQIIEVVVFQIKTWIWIFLLIQLRWTLPRLRVDQLMRVSWQYMTPLAFTALIGTAIWEAFLPSGSRVVSLVLIALACLAAAYYIWRVFRQMWFTKSHFDLNPII
jgi:NADH-quinone oxidoreductase subunit H